MSNLTTNGSLLVVFLAIIAGCGTRETYSVTGMVKLKDGTPLPSGRIILTGGASSSHGQIQEDGSFTLGTFDIGDGAKPGDYTIVIVGATEPDTRTYEEISLGKGKSPRFLIHSKYGNAKTSDLRAKIDADQNELVLEVEPFEGKSD